jgi:hypothetical protein
MISVDYHESIGEMDRDKNTSIEDKEIDGCVCIDRISRDITIDREEKFS